MVLIQDSSGHFHSTYSAVSLSDLKSLQVSSTNRLILIKRFSISTYSAVLQWAIAQFERVAEVCFHWIAKIVPLKGLFASQIFLLDRRSVVFSSKPLEEIDCDRCNSFVSSSVLEPNLLISRALWHRMGFSRVTLLSQASGLAFLVILSCWIRLLKISASSLMWYPLCSPIEFYWAYNS